MAAKIGTLTDAEIDAFSATQLTELITGLKEEQASIKKFVAKEDAQSVWLAVAGVGTDEDRLVDVIGNRTKAQLDACSAECVAQHGKTLLQLVSGDCSGNFGDMMSYALMDIDDYGATVFTKATKGAGTDEDALVDLVNTRTCAELAAIKAKWSARNEGAIVDILNKEFGPFSKYFKKIMINLFNGFKSESTTVDRAAAVEQAKQLYKAGVGKMGTDEDVFIEILTKQSRAQIQAIKEEYEKAQNMSLKRAIEKEMSGNLETALIALLEPSIASYTALALNKAVSGVGADKERIARILGGTDKKLMGNVAALYLDTFGKTLKEAFKSELTITGDFLKACIAWCESKDITNGAEYAVHPTEPKALAKFLKAERDAMLTSIVTVDAKLIRNSCKGLGTNDAELVRIVCSRSKEHMMKVDRVYHTLFGKSLIQEIKGECSGDYEDLLVAIVSPYDDFDAYQMKKACDGLGTDEKAVVELLAPRTNERIRAMKAKYDAKNSKPLIDRLNSELSGNLKSIVHQWLKAERNAEGPADLHLADTQAQTLHNAGVAQWGTDEKVFIDILCKSSRAQIEAIKASYEKQFNMSVKKAIEKETSGDFEMALLACLYSPTEFHAKALKKAMAGLGTDEAAVVRAIGGHDKNELFHINEFYLETYGSALVEDLKSELSGCLRMAAVTWTNVPDPLDLQALKRAKEWAAAHPTPPNDRMSATTTCKLGVGEHAFMPPDLTSTITLGVGWDIGQKTIDLDAGVIMLDAKADIVDVIYFANKTGCGVSYGGDNRTGAGEGDDETINVDLAAVPAHVHTIVFTVHVFTAGASFSDVRKSHARLMMPATNHVMAIVKLGPENKKQGVAFAMMQRQPSGWCMVALGRGVNGNAAPSEETRMEVRNMCKTVTYTVNA